MTLVRSVSGYGFNVNGHNPVCISSLVEGEELAQYVLRTLASRWNKEKFRCYEAQIEESEKAGSRRESNPGHLACAASALPLSYDNGCGGWWLSGCRSSVASKFLFILAVCLLQFMSCFYHAGLPAQKADIRVGDTIVEVEGTDVTMADAEHVASIVR